jgi:WD40 repeat protein
MLIFLLVLQIWDTHAVLLQIEEEDDNIDKLLFTMYDHEGIIHCVRFSPNGNFIASVSNIDSGPFIWSPGI